MSLDVSVVPVDQDRLGLAQTGFPKRPQLKISVGWRENSALMVLAGEVDVSTAPLLTAHLEEIAPLVRTDLILDFDRVTFLDVSGLSFLVKAHKQLASQDARLVVFAPTRQIRRLFELTSLVSYLVISPEPSASN